MSDALECRVCGAAIASEAEAVYGAGRINTELVQAAEAGGSFPLSDLFLFDDGPYCSLDCSVAPGEA